MTMHTTENQVVLNMDCTYKLTIKGVFKTTYTAVEWFHVTECYATRSRPIVNQWKTDTIMVYVILTEVQSQYCWWIVLSLHPSEHRVTAKVPVVYACQYNICYLLNGEIKWTDSIVIVCITSGWVCKHVWMLRMCTHRHYLVFGVKIEDTVHVWTVPDFDYKTKLMQEQDVASYRVKHTVHG